MKKKVISNVYESRDYSEFKSLLGNREIKNLHLKRLITSFKNDYLISPIIVNEKFEIIDGQHRFEAAVSIGAPIYFIIVPNYGLREVQILNKNMEKWKNDDHLNSGCALGNPEYLKFRDFMEKFPAFGISACEAILSNQTSNGVKTITDKDLITPKNKKGKFNIRLLKEGLIEIPDYEKSLQSAEKIMMLKPYYNGYNRSIFVKTMIGLFKHPNYSHAQLLERLNANPTALQHCVTITKYQLLIEEIYNYKSRDKTSLRY
jgi:hypothetical protein